MPLSPSTAVCRMAGSEEQQRQQFEALMAASGLFGTGNTRGEEPERK
jgi:hypothetical protein